MTDQPIPEAVLAELERLRAEYEKYPHDLYRWTDYENAMMTHADALLATARRYAKLREDVAEKEREWREEADRFSALSGDMLTNEGEALASVKVATLLQAADEIAAMKGGDRE